MTFVDFARMHGILIDFTPPLGKWQRYPTEDKPHHRNGAVKYLGDCGWVQNHATMTEPETWFPDAEAKPVDRAKIQAAIDHQAKQRALDAAGAAKKAGWILHQCRLEAHPYLASKGFDEMEGNVWHTTDKAGAETALLVIPMFVDGHVVGIQMINEVGAKKFLLHQRTHEATFTMGKGALPVLCEGFATGHSLRLCLQALKVPSRVIVCFSAGNLAKMAKHFTKAFVVGEHDMPSPLAPEPGGMGRKVAVESGHPFYIPAKEGHDLNDQWKMHGTFATSQALRLAMLGNHAHNMRKPEA